MARLNALRFFVTYAQVNDWEVSEFTIGAFFQGLPHFDWCEVAKESHADGGTHYHVVVVFKQRFQRPYSAFDYEGYHPNILTIRNGGTDLYNRRHYLRKGEVEPHTPQHHAEAACTYIYIPHSVGTPPPYTEPSKRLDWGDILDSAASAEHFLRLVRDNQPKEYVLRNDAIKAFAQAHYSAAQNYTSPYLAESFVTPPELDEWVQECIKEVGKS